jgi:hypothetical protein
MSEPTAFVAAGTATQPQRLVVGEGASVDALQASGEWLATDHPVEVRR